MSAALVTATITVAIAFQFLHSPKEKQLKDEMHLLKEQYSHLDNELNDVKKSLAQLENRDNKEITLKKGYNDF